jgi:hypothetical protein
MDYKKRTIQTIAGQGNLQCMFDINAAVNADRTIALITFPNSGTVNNVLPSNINSTLSVSASGTFYVICTISTNTNQVASAVVTTSTSPPTPPTALLGAAPGTVNVLIGLVINGVAIKAWSCKGITLTPIEAFRTAKASPAPFEAKYDIYYTWAIS